MLDSAAASLGPPLRCELRFGHNSGFSFTFPSSFCILRAVVDKKREPSRFAAQFARHASAFAYVLREVLPVILTTGRRPVIFSRFIGMGDIICTIPATRELMKRHPGATFIYNCHQDFAAVPGIAAVAARVTSFPDVGLVGHWYRFLLGGFYHFAHGDDIPGQAAQEPMVMEFCRQFSVSVTDEHPLLEATFAARANAIALLAGEKLNADQLVIIHCGPSWTVKEWPQEHWAKLVALLRERGFTNIAQVGVGRYLTVGSVAVTPVPGAVSLLDKLSVEECIAVIAQAKLFVGIDSGLLHLAAATRTASVAVWGPTDPRLFYAEKFRGGFLRANVDCAGCEHLKPRTHWFANCPFEIKCMKAIAPEDVLQVCLKTLGQRAD